MEEITLQVQRDEQSGRLVAWWDDPSGEGGITTQGDDLRDLQQQITDAVAVHFDDCKTWVVDLSGSISTGGTACPTLDAHDSE